MSNDNLKPNWPSPACIEPQPIFSMTATPVAGTSTFGPLHPFDVKTVEVSQPTAEPPLELAAKCNVAPMVPDPAPVIIEREPAPEYPAADYVQATPVVTETTNDAVATKVDKLQTMLDNVEMPYLKGKVEAVKEAKDSVTTADDFTLFMPTGDTVGLSHDELIEQMVRKYLDSNPDNRLTQEVYDEIERMASIIQQNSYAGNKFNNFFEKGNALKTEVFVPAKNISIKPSLKKMVVTSDDELVGSNAVAYFDNELGVGIPAKIPLWDSGIIVELSTVTEQEILDLNLRLARQQIELGKDTRGEVFSGDDSYIVGAALEFILSKVTKTNLKDASVKVLKNLILVSDIPALLAGILKVIYPDGYPIIQPCIKTLDGHCTYEIVAKQDQTGNYPPDSLLNFDEVLYIDPNTISAEDIEHMCMDMGSRTIDHIKAYQARRKETLRKEVFEAPFTIVKGKTSTVKMTFKTPSINDYLLTGRQYVANIKSMLDSLLREEDPADYADETKEDKEQRRAANLRQLTAVNALKKHSAWIETIILEKTDGSSKRVSDDPTKYKLLDTTFAKVPNFKPSLEQQLQAYKEKSITAWTGLPNFKCPMCGSSQTDPDSHNPSLIPLNLIAVFFTIMDWRVAIRQMLMG